MGCKRLTYQKNNTLLKVVQGKTPFFLNPREDKKPYRTKKRLNAFKYKYNGKEWQNEFNLNLYDLGARGHDPARVQFGGIDPRAEEYYSQSPYVFAANNPVFYVDINGEGVDTDFKLDKDGKVTRVDPKDNSDKDRSDTLYATDENGNVNKNKSVTIQKKEASDSTIISDLSNKSIVSGQITTNYASTNNLNDAASIFLFSANNSNVEFGIGQSSDNNNFIVLTSHKERLITRSGLGKFKRYTHSHLSGERPSGAIINGRKRGDIYQRGVGRFPRAIYSVQKQTYLPYDKKGKIGNPRNANSLNKFMSNYLNLSIHKRN